jgi:hypothetical protein
MRPAGYAVVAAAEKEYGRKENTPMRSVRVRSRFMGIW